MTLSISLALAAAFFASIVLCVCGHAQPPAPSAPKQIAPAQTPKPEDAPPDAKFLKTSPTLEGLTLDQPADLTWRGERGEAFFLWVTPPDAAGKRVFTFNRAYFVRQNGRTFWAFLDNSNFNTAEWNSPLNRFLIMKHFRATAAMPTLDYPDGPVDKAELISSAEDGRTLVRVTYPSSMGDFLGHIELPSWLVYLPTSGSPQLASMDMGADYHSRNGWIQTLPERTFDVAWHEPTNPIPFHLRVRQRTLISDSWGETESYITCIDSTWTGPLPLGSVRDSLPQYAIADGKMSLTSFAFTLARYHSSSDDELTQRLWVELLARENPSLEAETMLEKDVHIRVPDMRAAAGQIRELTRQPAAPADP